jgi:hypothetical protein
VISLQVAQIHQASQKVSKYHPKTEKLHSAPGSLLTVRELFPTKLPTGTIRAMDTNEEAIIAYTSYACKRLNLVFNQKEQKSGVRSSYAFSLRASQQ